MFQAKVLAPVNPFGGTNIQAGLTACYEQVRNGKGSRSIILLTDGQSFGAPIANQIKSEGISIVTIGIGKNVNADYLKDIASDPAEDFYISAEFEKLGQKVAEVAATTCVLPDFKAPASNTPAPGAAVSAGPGAAIADADIALGRASPAEDPFTFCGEGEECN
ncbi:hypothetical protein BWQ96_03285 [Gracilariopsis chorda]|uniref:VWFA domain-containing protein n=1 Tax=Gracilariopsis chorda TaxID=448386 RepID=A0A2V3IZ36_9FLOR|nr:hypothetical protein BWQ96_03285 [Gracilariopsis chorda]|eukprot:PXF46947.1 hypothetical protein BWQ96_03285 [Gracilariopsis chorda]